MWVAHGLYRLDGLSYEEAVNKVAQDFHKSPKTVEAALSKAKTAGRAIC
jgi:DNA-directed RNA polymerase specialized sigma24 family protein